MTITVKIDKFGKIFIPKRVRGELVSDEFELEVCEGRLELTPIRSPLALFGTLGYLDNSELDEMHGEEHEFDT